MHILPIVSVLFFAVVTSSLGASLLTFVFYFAGQFLRAWVKARGIIRSPKNKTITSYGAYVREYGPLLVFRFFVSQCLFMVWLGKGPSIGALPAREDLTSLLALLGIVGLIGVGIDHVVDEIGDKLPFLKGQIPSEPDGAPVAAAAAAPGDIVVDLTRPERPQRS